MQARSARLCSSAARLRISCWSTSSATTSRTTPKLSSTRRAAHAAGCMLHAVHRTAWGITACAPVEGTELALQPIATSTTCHTDVQHDTCHARSSMQRALCRAALCRAARGLCWNPCRIGTAVGSALPIWACWPHYRLFLAVDRTRPTSSCAAFYTQCDSGSASRRPRHWHGITGGTPAIMVIVC